MKKYRGLRTAITLTTIMVSLFISEKNIYAGEVQLTPWRIYQTGNFMEIAAGESWNQAYFNSFTTSTGETINSSLLAVYRGEQTISTVKPADGFTANIASNGCSADWDEPYENSRINPWMLRTEMTDIEIQYLHNYTVSFKISASKGKYASITMSNEYGESVLNEDDEHLLAFDTEPLICTYNFTNLSNSETLDITIWLGSFAVTKDYDGTDITEKLIYGTENLWKGTVYVSNFSVVDNGLDYNYAEETTKLPLEGDIADNPWKDSFTNAPTSNSTNNINSVELTELAKPNITKLKNIKKRKIVVKWTKNSQGDGYIVQYFDKKNKKVKRTKRISGSAKKVILTGFKIGSKYCIRIRSYKKVDGKTYYSAWSSKKKIKVKK